MISSHDELILLLKKFGSESSKVGMVVKTQGLALIYLQGQLVLDENENGFQFVTGVHDDKFATAIVDLSNCQFSYGRFGHLPEIDAIFEQARFDEMLTITSPDGGRLVILTLRPEVNPEQPD